MAPPRLGRLATGCKHKDRPRYALDLCVNCYRYQYVKAWRAKQKAEKKRSGKRGVKKAR